MGTRNIPILLGGFLIAAGIIYLVCVAMQGSTVYYLTIEEFLQQRPAPSDQGLRIAGVVASGSIRRQPQAASVSFELRGVSGDDRLKVVYTGTIPDLFRENARVVLEGEYQPDDQTFHAVTLMTSCPSKYQSKLDRQ
jgi:cytochrome c-type biogenesis protein CcmE